MYDLRKIGSKSAPVLSQLWKDTFIQAYSDVHSQENLTAYCDDNFSLLAAESKLSDEKILCKIARMDDIAVGFYLLKDHDCPIHLDARSAELKQIYILQSHYGQGLGGLLYDDAIRAVKHYNRQYVWPCVSDINHRAKAFYKKLNFNAVGVGPNFSVGTDRLTSTIMARKI